MATDLRAVAFVSHGRWIARCPRPFCTNAEQFGACQDGSPGGLTDSFWCREHLGGCGLRCPADWPANLEDIEYLLLQRPVAATRNWLPDETLHDLLEENITHGVLPVSRDAVEGGVTGKVLAIEGDRLVRNELAGVHRHEIGGT